MAIDERVPPSRVVLRIALLGPDENPIKREAESVLRASDGVEIVINTDQRTSVAAVREAGTDVLIAAGYHHFIGPQTRAVVRSASVGLHPSLLPAYRGSYPLWWALKNREREVGLTLYELDDGIDTGDIIGQTRIAIEAGDSFAGLYDRVALSVSELLVPFLQTIKQGRTVQATTQDESKATTYRTPSRWLRAVMKARWALEAAVRR